MIEEFESDCDSFVHWAVAGKTMRRNKRAERVVV